MIRLAYTSAHTNKHTQSNKQMNKHVSDVHVYLYTCDDTMQTSIVVANTTITTITIKAALSLN